MVFVKGNTLSKGRPKGAKNKATLLRDERRAIFDNEASQNWRNTIKQLRPEYIADQFMGKTPDILKVDAKVERNGEDIIAIATEAARILKQKKT